MGTQPARLRVARVDGGSTPGSSPTELSIGPADNSAVDADQELIPRQVGDRVLDEPDAAVAQADIHAAGVHAAGLAADVVLSGVAGRCAGVAIAGHAELAAVGNCAAKVKQVWFSSPPSSQLGGPVTMKFELGPALYDRASQHRLIPPKPIAQTPRPSDVSSPARISATKIVLDSPSVTAASVTP